MTPSKEFLGQGNAHRHDDVHAYFCQTAAQRECVRAAALAALPDEDFATLDRAFKAADPFYGRVPGVFLAQVTVFKCQSKAHRDGLDGEKKWCLTFNGGKYRGGVIIFPDLGLKIAYGLFFPFHPANRCTGTNLATS